MASTKFYIGVDVGTASVRAGLVSDEGKVRSNNLPAVCIRLDVCGVPVPLRSMGGFLSGGEPGREGGDCGEPEA